MLEEHRWARARNSELGQDVTISCRNGVFFIPEAILNANLLESLLGVRNVMGPGRYGE